MKKMRKMLAVILTAAAMLTCASPVMAGTTVKTTVTKAAAVTADRALKNGLIKETNGKTYYYKKGVKITDKLGIKIGKNYYKISKSGIVKKVTEVQGLAGIQMDKCNRDMKKAFKWSSTVIKYRSDCGTPAKGQAAEEYYAIYGFKTHTGDCSVQAATFCYMMRALGRNVKYVEGSVPQALDPKTKKPTKFGAHAWCTLKSGDKVYVYDPNFAYTYRNATPKRHSGYKFTYGTPKTYRYFNKSGKKEYK